MGGVWVLLTLGHPVLGAECGLGAVGSGQGDGVVLVMGMCSCSDPLSPWYHCDCSVCFPDLMVTVPNGEDEWRD